MAIKTSKDITQMLGDGGGTNPTVPTPSTKPTNTTKNLDLNTQTGIVQMSGTGETNVVALDKNLIGDNIDKTNKNIVKNDPKFNTITEVLGTNDLDTTGGTGGGDNNSGNAYYDVINANSQKPEYKPTGKDGINGDASAGAGAAKDTQYSWDKKGTDQAQNQYQQDALKAKQDALANRQTIEQNALQYQQQADMMQYANNQNAEKVGWTGGYVLDQNRQMEYLKASIQAQMYGAMELQKYGYDSALAAAR